MNKTTKFWHEAPRLFGVAPKGRSKDTAAFGSDAPLKLDYTDKTAGDFSIRLLCAFEEGMSVFVTPGPYQDAWELKEGAKLHVCAKSSRAVQIKIGESLVDVSEDWCAYELPIAQNLSAIAMDVPLGEGEYLWLDNIYFTDSDGITGVTDKSTKQRMREAAATKTMRVQKACREGAEENLYPIVKLYNKLYLNIDNDKVNELLYNIFTGTPAGYPEYDIGNNWSLTLSLTMKNTYMFHLSNCCSSSSNSD